MKVRSLCFFLDLCFTFTPWFYNVLCRWLVAKVWAWHKRRYRASWALWNGSWCRVWSTCRDVGVVVVGGGGRNTPCHLPVKDEENEDDTLDRVDDERSCNEDTKVKVDREKQS